MAEMIDAKEAKGLLNCDDDTLNNHINSGQIRAQRVGGKLMLNKEDVAKLAGDDGTIVLTGDSDNLQIDLGKVVDDTSETVIQAGAGKHATPAGGAKESITFSEELEVVNFDDKNTQDMGVDDSKKTADLNFTDSNTAVMTSVDETAANATAAGETAAQSPTEGQAGPSSSRRSVRSTRNQMVESEPVSVIWPILMGVVLLVMLLGVVPYYFMGMWTKDELDPRGGTMHGVDDNNWTAFASNLAGFSAEPDLEKFKKRNQGDWKDLAKTESSWRDPVAEWRYLKYRGALKGPMEKRDSFLIEKYDAEGRKVISKGGKAEWPVKMQKASNADIEEEVVDIGVEAIRPAGTPAPAPAPGPAPESAPAPAPAPAPDAGAAPPAP